MYRHKAFSPLLILNAIFSPILYQNPLEGSELKCGVRGFRGEFWMINNRIKSFISQPYLIYLLLFIAILFIFIMIIFYQFSASIFLNTSLDSSRYLLSAMAQALAAILAIVAIVSCKAPYIIRHYNIS